MEYPTLNEIRNQIDSGIKTTKEFVAIQKVLVEMYIYNILDAHSSMELLEASIISFEKNGMYNI